LRVCPELHHCHCPAAGQTLERLRRRGMLLALVTGNLTRIGWRKLERAGLREYFAFGAFGEMAKTRAGLVKIALSKARRAHALGPKAPVALVGDATSDILAAHRNRIRSISVQTGITPVEELRAMEPDYLLRNLRDLRFRMIEHVRKDADGRAVL
jgi:phosphoglycolate phosphatase-like HAD superfamily hydrolase